MRVLSLPMEDLVTVEALAALAAVAATEAAVVEPSPGTELPRLPPVVKFPARNAAMSRDNRDGFRLREGTIIF